MPGPKDPLQLAISLVLFLIPYGMLVAELGSAFPMEGGPYEWARMSFGRAAGAVTAVLYWLSNPMWLGGTLTATTIAALDSFILHKPFGDRLGDRGPPGVHLGDGRCSSTAATASSHCGISPRVCPGIPPLPSWRRRQRCSIRSIIRTRLVGPDLARSRDPRIQHAAAIFSAACSARSPAASPSLRTTHTSAWLRLQTIRSSSSSGHEASPR